MTVIWCPLVGGKEVQNSNNVGSGHNGDPVNQSAYEMVDSHSFGEVRVVRVRIRYGFDGSA